MQDLIFATYLIPPFAFIIVTIAGISAKSATSYAQHFRRRVLEQEIKSPHYVGFYIPNCFKLRSRQASRAKQQTLPCFLFKQSIRLYRMRRMDDKIRQQGDWITIRKNETQRELKSLTVSSHLRCAIG